MKLALRRRDRRGLSVAIGALTLVVIASVVAPATLAEGISSSQGRRFCDHQPVVDYTRPFSRMPSVRRLPRALSFGLGKVRMYRSSEGPVIPGRGGVFYSFTGAGTNSISLDWDVEATLEQVDRQGRRIGNPRTSRIHLKNTRTLRSKVIGFKLPAAPAFYRISIRILGTLGQQLGHFGEYVRVVKSRIRADLRGEAPAYAAGELAHFKVVNLGTRTVSYGVGLTVEVFNGVAWEPTSAFLAHRIPRKAIALGAGVTGACEVLLIPTDVPLGRYRVVKLITPLEGHVQSLTALFEISAKRSD